ncbi:MAG TPA: HepT-like ribonuclease domain-containing protein [Vicinamibacterales bacterium]|nr:HepT-like ribonuclease domain-containing protein [Vicinamibacterales bacterium]
MPPENRDAAYIWDMLEAAHAILTFTNGVSLEDYLADRKLQLAVERAIEIIGEAARLVSPELKASHSHIPWRQIVAQRNVLAHDYGEIKQDRIWLVATDRIPELISQLQPLLPPLDPD